MIGTSKNTQPATPGDASAIGKPATDDHGSSNIFAEFVSSAWQSGAQKRLEGLTQLAGGKVSVESEKQDKSESTWTKIAHTAGTAVGDIAVWTAMSFGIGKELKFASNFALMGSRLETTLNYAAESKTIVSGTTGFLNGTLLTPTSPDESPWRRLGHGATDALTFTTLTGVSGSKYLGSLGTGILGRSASHAISGAAAGFVNTNVDAATHGKIAGVEDDLEGIAGWAVGNFVFGHSAHYAGKGFERLGWRSFQNHQESIRAATEHFEFSGEDAHIPPLQLLNMRKLAATGDLVALKQQLLEYHRFMEKGFPLPGEIAGPGKYEEYLRDPEDPFNIRILVRAPEYGGINTQVLQVPEVGGRFNVLGILEHIEVDKGERNKHYAEGMLKVIQGDVERAGGTTVFWEYNDPAKMTPEQIAVDSGSDLVTQDRVKIWAKKGAYVLRVPSTGEIAPYIQPAEGDDNIPVEYCSLAWLSRQGFEGQTLSKDEYRHILHTFHGNRWVDPATDPSVAKYNAMLDALPDNHFEFIKLSDYLAEKEAAEGALAHPAIVRPGEIVPISDAPANPEVAKAQEYQRATAHLSPWLRTIPSLHQYPHYEGNRLEAPVVIVGGGLVGLQTARVLAANDIGSVVLEQNLLGSGTSRMMGGMNTYLSDANAHTFVEKYGLKSFELFMRQSRRAQSDTSGLAALFKSDYGIHNSYSISYEANAPFLRAEWELLHRYDPNVIFVPAAAEGIHPQARSALIFLGDGNLNPLKFMHSLASTNPKAQFFENSPVTGLRVRGPGDIEVHTPGGMIRARKVVFATNGPPSLFSHLNDHLTPVQTFTVLARTNSPAPGNYWDNIDPSYTYWRPIISPQFRAGEAIVGGAARNLDMDTAAVPLSPGLRTRVHELFGDSAVPNTDATALIFTQYGDGAPIVALHPNNDDVIVATGAGGNGLMNSQLIANAVHAIVSGRPGDNLFSPEREIFRSMNN